MQQQLLDTWQIHNSKNMLLLQHLPDLALGLTTGARSRTIGEQLSHVHNTRINWLEHVSKPLYDASMLLGKGTQPDAAALLAAFEKSYAAIQELIGESWAREGRLSYFKKGLIPFIGYLIAHESHHRGAILLQLKQNNIKLPDVVKWGMWKWS